MFGNNITNGGLGIWLSWSFNNKFYHNNLMNNTVQVYDLAWDNPDHIPSSNVWDDGYPSGGNYWSDYTGVDVYSGPYRDETGSDGIGDSYYNILDLLERLYQTDMYPLMNPRAWRTMGVGVEKSFIESTLVETVLGQKAVLNNVTVSGDLNGTLNFTSFEIVSITAGSFAGNGFSKGEWQANLEGISYEGYWKGMHFLKSDERKIYLKGMISGGLRGIAEGYWTESVNESGVYDQYCSIWRLNHIGSEYNVSATINLAGITSYQEFSEYLSTELYVLQTSIEGTTFGHHIGPLSTVLTHLRVVSEDSPYFGEGFSIISYISDSGSGEGWTYDKSVSSNSVELNGMFTKPLLGIVSATLDEIGSSRTLFLMIEGIDLGLPPAADLIVEIWGPERVSPGQTVDYVIEYRNDGLREAKDVELAMELPFQVEYLSSTAGGTFSEGLYGIIWSIENIPVKSKGYVSSEVMVKWGLSIGTVIEPTARITGDRINIATDPNVVMKYEIIEAAEGKFKFVANISNQSESGNITIDSTFTEVYQEFPPTLEYNEMPEKIEFIANATVEGSLKTESVSVSIPKKIFDRIKELVNLSKDLLDFNKEKEERELYFKWLFQRDKISLEDKQLLSKMNEGFTEARAFISCFTAFMKQQPSGWIYQAFGDYNKQFVRKSLPAIDIWVGWAIYRHQVGPLPDGWDKSLVITYELRELNKEARWEYYTPELWSAEYFYNRAISSQKSNISVARDPNIKYGPEGYVLPGQELDYKVEYENEGKGIAFGVYFTDTLDEDLNASTLEIGPVISALDGSIIADPGAYNPSTRTITWLVGEVVPGEGGYANFSAKVRNDASEYTEIINYATVYFPSVPETTRTNAIVSVVGQPNIAVTNVTPSEFVIEKGSTQAIDVTVANKGYFPETFNLTLYANATAIQTQNVTLLGRNSDIITFLWNTTGFAKGNYTISAYAWPVPSEVKTDDNLYIDGTGQIKISEDEVPPVTVMDVGEPKFVIDDMVYLTSNTPITLTAEDNPQGSGIASTSYKIRNSTHDTGWLTYTKPFNLTGFADGTYFMDFNSTDNAGNVEPTNAAIIILDNTPPTSTISIGQPKCVADKTYVTRDTLFGLDADDATGSGIYSIAYRISNTTYDSGWLPYAASFHLTALSDGVYTISFNATDNVGNMEAPESIQVTLFSWNCVFTDSYGRGTMLKINTQYKLFQFIAPGKDFGVRQDPKMFALCSVILIGYKDSEMQLAAAGAYGRLTFCTATAWDKQTGKRYLLIQKPIFRCHSSENLMP